MKIVLHVFIKCELTYNIVESIGTYLIDKIYKYLVF